MVGFKKKGSLTVEAAFVVPVCLTVCFLVLQSLFYLHHVSWYTAAAWECVLTGMQQGQEQETANERWQKVRKQQTLPVGTIQADADTSGSSCRMEIRGTMSALAGLPAMEFKVTVKRSAQDAAAFLRRVKRLKTLADNEGGLR